MAAMRAVAGTGNESSRTMNLTYFLQRTGRL